MKITKYSWGYNKDGSEKYAIVVPLEDDCAEVMRIKEDMIIDAAVHTNCHWARMVYGSRARYSKSGEIFYFRDVKEVTELDSEEVMTEHFTGLL